MSREIKFRGWVPADDEEPGYMINGDELAFEEYEPLCDLLSRGGIMQYTGLKDKNGTEIYEGDVVRLRNSAGFHSLATVEFLDGCFELKLSQPRYDNGVTRYREYVKVYVANHAIEVIGNIYENADLLNPTR